MPIASSAFVPSHVARLDLYQPGKPIDELERELGITGAIKVASNENPLGPSPRALAALPAALGQLHRYPDAAGVPLRRALAARIGCEAGHIALGNGSNDLLYQLVLATCDVTDEVLTHECSFLSYRLAAQVAGRRFVAAPTTPELACDIDALIAAFTPHTRLVVVGTPNNPTGTVIARAGLDRLIAALPERALLVIDEAYTEYAAQWPEVDHADGLAAWRREPRVIVLRTFSKIYGLAGLRIGFAVADPAVIDVLGARRAGRPARAPRDRALPRRDPRPGRAGLSVARQLRADRLRPALGAALRAPAPPRRDRAADGGVGAARAPPGVGRARRRPAAGDRGAQRRAGGMIGRGLFVVA
ncbi:MAG: aminotransferase class I/II-fold pyridoxal phosphate-dependent enzyme [Deltaproteobacteria bacterium]|nr:MAG: aminotransferase class I/II-fold pyridoxal phosphate-dependent enzyme [Deltaproteobacteria bacterium]